MVWYGTKLSNYFLLLIFAADQNHWGTKITSNEQKSQICNSSTISFSEYGALRSLKTLSFAVRGYLTRFNRGMHPYRVQHH